MLNAQREMQRAGAALRSGDPRAAARACRKILSDDPRHIEARYLHGRCLAALGSVDEAASEFRRVLSARANHLPALVDLGITETLGGRHAEARAWLEQARAIDARPAEIHFGLGLCLLGLDEPAAAVHAFEESLARNPHFPDALNNLGAAYYRLGRFAEAIGAYQRAIAAHPAHADAHRNLGDALLRTSDTAAAARAFERAAELQPADPGIYADLGAALLANGDPEGAIAALQRASELEPTRPGIWANLGEMLRVAQRDAAATAAFTRALSLHPAPAEAHLGLGRIALAQGDYESACTHLERAGIDPLTDPRVLIAAAGELETLGLSHEALAVLDRGASTQTGVAELQAAAGALLHRLGRLPEALDRYDRALDIDGTHASALLHSGHALESMGASSRALAIFERLLSRDPEDVAAMAGVASCALRLCDWERSERMLGALRASSLGIDALPAFLLFATDWPGGDMAESLRRRARSARWPSALPALPAARRAAPDDRLRLAYLSPDFRTHPVAYALAGLIERHDRSRIESIGVALSAGDDSPIQRRLHTCFDDFIDASAMSDRAVASLMRERKIDIAVDLAGLTTGSRPAIFALRAAPVQINFLGYPGSMGFEFIDYIVADGIVIPPDEEGRYAELVLRMPTTYLPFDDRRTLEPFEGGRAAAGLPAEGLVFCAFGSAFKINRPVFEVWMRLLHEVPGSMLWLRSSGPAVRGALERAADQHGIAADRLHFAAFEPRMEIHLARLALADVFLDTAPYNAHTTASEALWAGVPVVSRLGSSFAGRVGASLLEACGVPELVCPDLETYHDRALELARSAQRRGELRARLRESCPRAFDTGRYARDFEEILLRIDPRERAGRRP